MLLKREALQKVVPGRGKFRSFLLTALSRFLADQHNWRQAQKRGGGQVPISLDAQDAEYRYQLESKDGETPERLYEPSWARTLIDRALANLQKKYEAEGKAQLFEQLRCFIVAGAEGPSYAELGARLGLSEDAVRRAVKRLQARYGKAIREEIAQAVATGSEIEEEPPQPLTRLSTLTNAEQIAAGQHRGLPGPNLLHLVRGDFHLPLRCSSITAQNPILPPVTPMVGSLTKLPHHGY